MKWNFIDSGRWESADGQWRIETEGVPSNWGGGDIIVWRIHRWDGHRWRTFDPKSRHRTLAAAKVAVVMHLEDAKR